MSLKGKESMPLVKQNNSVISTSQRDIVHVVLKLDNEVTPSPDSCF